MAEDAHPLGDWQPWSPREVARFFAPLAAPWWIAGGWAIDLFLGSQTRAHADIDVLILRRDQHAVRALFGAWDMQAALPPPRDEARPFRPWLLDDVLERTVHDIWCRPTSTQPWAIQLMLDDTHDEEWLFRRAPGIARPVATIGCVSADGLPYLAPEIQLLYKSRGRRPKDEADFRHVLPALDRERRQWLTDGLVATLPHHPWLDLLADS